MDVNPWKYTEEEFNNMRVQVKHLLVVFLAHVTVCGIILIPQFLIENWTFEAFLKTRSKNKWRKQRQLIR